MLGKRKTKSKNDQEDFENDDFMDIDDNNMITVCGLVIDIEKITK